MASSGGKCPRTDKNDVPSITDHDDDDDESNDSSAKKGLSYDRTPKAECIYLVNFHLPGTTVEIYRIPMRDLEDEQIVMLENENQAGDDEKSTPEGRDRAKFVKNTLKFFRERPELCVSNPREVGRSFKRSRDIIADVFHYYITDPKTPEIDTLPVARGKK